MILAQITPKKIYNIGPSRKDLKLKVQTLTNQQLDHEMVECLLKWRCDIQHYGIHHNRTFDTWHIESHNKVYNANHDAL